MTIRELFVALGYEVDKKSEKDVESSIKTIANKAKSLLGAIGIAFSIKGLADLAQAAADVEALKSQFKQVFGDMEQEASDRLQKIADDVGSNVMRMKGSFTQIAAFAKTTGLNEQEALELSERAMIAVADSAAFYDRSMEDATASLQSFLKGNFAQDAALGLSCTEVTRNTAAMQKYGKEFKDLDEKQKQLTLLQMVEEANRAAGAEGQAAAEANTWTNQLGNLQQSIKDLKATAGSTFLKPAIQVLKILTKVVQTATKAIDAYAGANGFLSREIERVKNLFKFMQPVVERVTKALSSGMKKAKDAFSKAIDKLGGMDNVLRILTIAVGAFIVLLTGPKLIGAIKTVGKLLKKAFAVNPKMLALVAVITLIALLIDDLINFMNGNDSLIGSLFEKAGIDGEAFRETIKGLVDKFMEFLPVIMEIGKALGQQLLNVIMMLIPLLMKIIQAILPIILDLISQLLPVIMQIIETVLPIILDLITQILPLLMVIIETFLPIIVDLLNTLFPIIEPIIALVASLVEAILPAVVSLLEGIIPIIELISTVLKPVVDIIGVIIKALGKVVGWIADGLTWLIELFFGGGKGADTSKAEEINGYAKGSDFTDDTFIAGEDGPELITGQRGKKVYNALETGHIFGNMAEVASAFGRAATANPNTASIASGDTIHKSVVQNVEINNSYTGGSAETQKNISKAMKKSAVDATTQMARSLAYARG